MKAGKQVKFLCCYCNKAGSIRRSHYIRVRRHFCSMKCYTDYRKYIMPPEEQNRYGKGLPKIERKFRHWCRITTNHAVRDGRLSREICEVCGRYAEAHHENYSQPLIVRWFCRKHHRELHQKINRGLRSNAKKQIHCRVHS